jgi:hypothetical protein
VDIAFQFCPGSQQLVGAADRGGDQLAQHFHEFRGQLPVRLHTSATLEGGHQGFGGVVFG